MKGSLGILGLMACLLVAGCHSHPEREAAEKELQKIQSDNDMVMSEWYRNGYFIFEINNGKYILNHFLLRLIGIHALSWLCLMIYLMVRPDPPSDNRGLPSIIDFLDRLGKWCCGVDGFNGPVLGISAWLILTNALLFAIWVILWLFVGIVIDVFVPNTYVTFDYVGFFTLIGLYAAIAATIVVRVINSISAHTQSDARSKVDGSLGEPTSSSVRSRALIRRGRMVRAMLKALFIAVASAIGSKLGGWIGGVLVFVISAGVSAFLECPSADSGQPQHPDHHQ